MVKTKVDAIIYELLEWLAHDPRAVLRALRAALGDAKFATFCQQMLARFDERREGLLAQVPPPTDTMEEGTIEKESDGPA